MNDSKSEDGSMGAVEADNAIVTAESDLLHRDTLARHFSERLQSLDASQGAVVGVVGPWGSGKSSFLNLVRRHLQRADVEVLEFNPWMFSGTDQLVRMFFADLAAQLDTGKARKNLVKALHGIGGVFAALSIIPWLGSGGRAMKAASKMLDQGILAQRKNLGRILLADDTLIVVFIDDIDRLTTSEIRQIFGLIQLTARLPNIVYAVALDRERVESALAEHDVSGRDNFSGRDYLEKILQETIDLPPVPPAALSELLIAALNQVMDGHEGLGPFDDSDVANILGDIVVPFLSNMRDVRRYVASFAATIHLLDGEVAVSDVLGLESIRVFQPDLFNRLYSAKDVLTGPVQSGSTPVVAELLLKGNESVVTGLFERLFPMALQHTGGMKYGHEYQATWLKGRRVAHQTVFEHYFDRWPTTQWASVHQSELAHGLFDQPDELDRFLRSLEPQELRDAIQGLEVYEDEFHPGAVIPVAIILLNLIGEIPERFSGLFDVSPDIVVGRVVLRLIRQLTIDECDAAAVEIYRGANSLSAKRQLLITLKVEDLEGSLVTPKVAEMLADQWVANVEEAAPEELLREDQLLNVLLTFGNKNLARVALPLPDGTAATLALLRSAATTTRSASLGSRRVAFKQRLSWDELVKVVGDAETLSDRLTQARGAAVSAADEELLALAAKYEEGWRPD